MANSADGLRRLVIDLKREAVDTSDRAIARRLGISPSLIVRVFHGHQKRLQRRTIQRVCERLQIHPDYFERNPEQLTYLDFSLDVLGLEYVRRHGEHVDLPSHASEAHCSLSSYATAQSQHMTQASRILAELLYRLQDPELPDPSREDLVRDLRRAYVVLRG